MKRQDVNLQTKQDSENMPDWKPESSLVKDKVSALPQTKLQSRKMRFLLAGVVGSVALGALFLMLLPLFHVRHVQVSGNFRIGHEEISRRIGVDESTNLLLFNTRAARTRIMENIYVGDVKFERVFPNRLYVTITERRLTAYLEHMPGSFLFLDDYGRVLEVRTYFMEPLPVLEGLQFDRFQLGEILEVPDTAAFNIIVQYAQRLNHHGLIERVSHINVSDASNIRIRINNIEFNVGGSYDEDEKVRTIAAVLEAMPNAELIPGFMDLREIRQEYFFKILH